LHSKVIPQTQTHYTNQSKQEGRQEGWRNNLQIKPFFHTHQWVFMTTTHFSNSDNTLLLDLNGITK
jgi:hypothetical protein